MGTNCAPLIAELFLSCYERNFILSLSGDKQADIIVAFNTISKYTLQCSDLIKLIPLIPKTRF